MRAIHSMGLKGRSYTPHRGIGAIQTIHQFCPSEKLWTRGEVEL